jgi:hypothetical protein
VRSVKVVVPMVVGLVVCAVVWFVMGIYTWTAIHSGWSQRQIDAFFVSVYLVPPILGVIAAVATYRSGKGRT